MSQEQKKSFVSSIGTKILGIALIGCIILGGVGFWQATQLRAIDRSYTNLLSAQVNGLVGLDDLSGQGDLLAHQLYMYIAQSSADDRKATSDAITKTISITNGQFATIQAGLPSDKQADLAKVKDEFAGMTGLSDQIQQAAAAGKIPDAVKLMMTSFEPDATAFDNDSNALLDWAKKILTQGSDANAAETSAALLTVYIVLTVGIVLSLVIAVVVSRTQILQPILALSEVMGRFTPGTALTVYGIERKDELGDMARVFDANVTRINRALIEDKAREIEEAGVKRKAMFTELADRFEQVVGSIANGVADTAGQLHGAAQSMASASDETNRQSSAVAAAAEEASANVQTVASAAEELTASIGEITRQVTESARVAAEAVENANATAAKVKHLTEAASKIDDVVGLINDIASQTNLLALNATIEAARAGEAGKGFAVVASEVKTLANQTARATADIANQIKGVQTSTEESASAIASVTDIIVRINEITAMVATAIEEQRAATQEIARNVEEASRGTADVSVHIQDVSQASTSASSASNQVLTSVGTLTEQSSRLKAEMAKFLDSIRAA